MKIAIIGAGVLGKALGILLKQADHEIVALSSRTVRSARVGAKAIGDVPVVGDPGLAALGADVVILAVPDRVIPSVGIQVATGGALRRGAVVAHLSGALPAGVLVGVRAAGGFPGSMHPLQSFATLPTAVRSLPGSFVFLEGAPEAVEVLRSLVASIDARAVPLATASKSLYHAAACTASNYLVTLIDCAAQLMAMAGVPQEVALPALLPLINGTIRNLESVGIPEALTGPIARGDAGTVRGHLQALRNGPPAMRRLYVELGLRTLDVARRKGRIEKAAAEQILGLLEEADDGGRGKG
ncbi:MAG TPA: Rossmann-like and DUF2520 domain-containing protein [Planctomycetota bacterium]|nr:Rossmann-like and DUF2520 domain-containing protein [Planctomycetota bacterium]